MPYRQTIAAAYDAGVEEEYNRLIETPLREAEYELIVELLDEYIPENSTVIDIGSGPGRYAEHLLTRNCKVGVVDLSAKSLKAFSDRMKESCCQQNIIFNQVSCATQLNWIPDSSTDAVLLMGPLYHLIRDEHREKALQHCHRILKPGGFLYSVFLSPFPVIAGSEDLNEGAFVFKSKSLFRHIKTEMTTHTHFRGFDVPQYRCWPGEAGNMLEKKHLKTIRIRNLDGIVSLNKQLTMRENFSEKEFLLGELKKTCELHELLGHSHQFLIVSKNNK